MEFLPDDHPSEIELKLNVIGIYNAKLEERDRRKRFVIDRGIVADVKKQQRSAGPGQRGPSKEDKDIINRVKCFSRLQTLEESNLLIDGILAARRLKRQLEIYRDYRAAGLKTLEEGRIFEAERKKREADIKSKRTRQNQTYDNMESLSNHREHSVGALTTFKNIIGPPPAIISNSKLYDLQQMKQAPGGDLLSDKELDLCCRITLLPLQYIAVKVTILQNFDFSLCDLFIHTLIGGDNSRSLSKWNTNYRRSEEGYCSS
jgi:transcriptional adapter 2-alpha